MTGPLTKVAEARRNDLHRELDRIVGVLVEEYRPEKIILYGSLAGGEVHEWTDIDLVVIKNTKTPYFERLFELSMLTRPRLAVDFFVYTPEEFEEAVADKRWFFVHEIIEKGKVLYERGRV